MPGCSWKAKGASAARSAWPNSTIGSIRRSSAASTATRGSAPISPKSPGRARNGHPRRTPSSSKGRLAHRTDPAGRASEKWTRFSAPSDAPAKRKSIGWVPKVPIHFWVRCCSRTSPDRADRRRGRGRKRAGVDEVALGQIAEFLRCGGASENRIPVRKAAEPGDDGEIVPGLLEGKLPDRFDGVRRVLDHLFRDGDDAFHPFQMIRPFRMGEGKEVEEFLVR